MLIEELGEVITQQGSHLILHIHICMITACKFTSMLFEVQLRNDTISNGKE